MAFTVEYVMLLEDKKSEFTRLNVLSLLRHKYLNRRATYAHVFGPRTVLPCGGSDNKKPDLSNGVIVGVLCAKMPFTYNYLWN